MGAHFSLDLHENSDLPDFLSNYRGPSIVAAPDATKTLFAVELIPPLAWIFGNEGQGVRPEIARLAKERVRIPMPGQAESLNVGAAAAICLFETVRQRRAP
jgi:TrmH family RNA methyltransferase